MNVLTVPLWEEVPDSIHDASYVESEYPDEQGRTRVIKITKPTITVYLPDARGPVPSVIVCPGGSFSTLVINNEGHFVARWLVDQGIAAIVLKYRLPSSEIMVNKSLGPLADVQRAIQLVRGRSAEWNLDPNQVGVMGFSAGGHLAAQAANLYAKPVFREGKAFQERPDFSLLIYPVISMQEGIVHEASRKNLIGSNASPETVDLFSLELQVNNSTPPTFLVHSTDDDLVVIQNSIVYYEALCRCGVQAEFHAYSDGGHGYGMGTSRTLASQWPSQCLAWLRRNQG